METMTAEKKFFCLVIFRCVMWDVIPKIHTRWQKKEIFLMKSLMC